MDSLKPIKEFVEAKSVSAINEEVEFTEADGSISKRKQLYIKGPFLQGDIENRNGRIYPVSMLESAIANFKNKMQGVGVGGELNHPQSSVQIDLERISHYITELNMVDKDGIGKAKIATTPKGEIARALINDGMILGVSTRGVGKLEKNDAGQDVVSEFDLITVDIVSDPSAPNAFVEAVMEGLQYYKDDNTNELKLLTTIDQLLHVMKENLAVLPKKQEDKNEKLYKTINAVLDGLK